jgi:hypothetical protein
MTLLRRGDKRGFAEQVQGSSFTAAGSGIDSKDAT